jgi:chromate transporter
MLFRTFFRLGWTGFGGPTTTMAMMKDACREHRWISSDTFDRLISICKILPGPTAFKLAIAIGMVARGPLAGLVTGFLFTAPSVVLVYSGALIVEQFGQLPTVQNFLWGMRPALFAVILVSTWSLADGRWREFRFWILFLVGAALTHFSLALEPVWILLGGTLSVLADKIRARQVTAAVDVSALAAIGWVSFKAGAFIFGSGLAIVPVLEHDFVRRYHFVTPEQFSDALSLGFLTPGPVVTSATFLGYFAGGTVGATVATLLIFLPSVLYTYICVPLGARILRGVWAKSFINGAVAMIIAAIVIASLRMGEPVAESWATVTLFFVGFGLSLRKVPPWIIIPASGCAGALIKIFALTSS